LKQLGHEVAELKCSPSLYGSIRQDSPDIVFNLSGVYGGDKTNLIPAVLEITAVPYTGSGILGLSLAQNYSKLFPLLSNAGICVPDYHILEAGSAVLPRGIHFPLLFFRDGASCGLLINDLQELKDALGRLPKQEEVLLLEQAAGEKLSVFILDNRPILKTTREAYLKPALAAYRLLEARGLVRFDFIVASEPILVGIDIAPDPLEDSLLQTAAEAGWNECRLFQSLLDCAARDH